MARGRSSRAYLGRRALVKSPPVSVPRCPIEDHSKKQHDSNDEYEVIFVKSFRHPKTGKVIRAADFGKSAFPIRVRKKTKAA